MTATADISAQERTYDTDALRLDTGFDGLKILRGQSDSLVLSIGVVKPVDVSRLLAESPNAVAQAKIFEANYRQGIWTALLGVAIWPTIYGINHIGTNQPVPLAVTIVSVALVGYGATRIDTAKRALSKAIWWYNRDLKK